MRTKLIQFTLMPLMLLSVSAAAQTVMTLNNVTYVGPKEVGEVWNGFGAPSTRNEALGGVPVLDNQIRDTSINTMSLTNAGQTQIFTDLPDGFGVGTTGAGPCVAVILNGTDDYGRPAFIVIHMYNHENGSATVTQAINAAAQLGISVNEGVVFGARDDAAWGNPDASNGLMSTVRSSLESKGIDMFTVQTSATDSQAGSDLLVDNQRQLFRPSTTRSPARDHENEGDDIIDDDDDDDGDDGARVIIGDLVFKGFIAPKEDGDDDDDSNDDDTGDDDGSNEDVTGDASGDGSGDTSDSAGDEVAGDEVAGDEGAGDAGAGDAGAGDAGASDDAGNGFNAGGDETGGDETGGDETGGDETGGDETGGDETGGDETGGDETGGDETGDWWGDETTSEEDNSDGEE